MLLACFVIFILSSPVVCSTTDVLIEEFLGPHYSSSALRDPHALRQCISAQSTELLEKLLPPEKAFPILWEKISTFLSAHFSEYPELIKEDNYPPFEIPPQLQHLHPWAKIFSALDIMWCACCVQDSYRNPPDPDSIENQTLEDNWLYIITFPHVKYARHDLQRVLLYTHRLQQNTGLNLCISMQENLLFKVSEYLVGLMLGRRIITLPTNFDNWKDVSADNFVGFFPVIFEHDLCIHTFDSLYANLMGDACAGSNASGTFLQNITGRILDEILHDIPRHQDALTTLFQFVSAFYSVHERAQETASPLDDLYTRYSIHFFKREVQGILGSLPENWDASCRYVRALMPLLAAIQKPGYMVSAHATKQRFFGPSTIPACTPQEFNIIWHQVYKCMMKANQDQAVQILERFNLSTLMDCSTRLDEKQSDPKIYCIYWNAWTCEAVVSNGIICAFVPDFANIESQKMSLFDCTELLQSMMYVSTHIARVLDGTTPICYKTIQPKRVVFLQQFHIPPNLKIPDIKQIRKRAVSRLFSFTK